MANNLTATEVETIHVTADRLPVCVRCRNLARASWNGRRPEAAGGAPRTPKAAYRVTVGTSQVERFECAACQRETDNPILYRFEVTD